MGLPGAIVTKAPMVAMFDANNPELRKCRPGSIFGFEDILPPSFKNATMDPVKVMPPWNVSQCFCIDQLHQELTDENAEVCSN